MARVSPVPEGYHTLTPYLVVDGAAEAIEFYKRAFGAAEIARIPGPGAPGWPLGTKRDGRSSCP